MTPLVALAATCAALAVLVLPGASSGDRGWARRPGRSGPGAGRVRRRQEVQGRPDAPLVLDLLAAVVESGAPVPAAVEALGRLLAEAGSPAAAHLSAVAAELAGTGVHRTPGSAGDLEVPLRRCLALAERSGAPVAALLRSAADELRRRRRRRAALAAARLGVRVVAPLGLCTLPAFALLAVVPVLLSLGRGLLG